MLKKKIAKIEDVLEKYRGLYTEQEDGTFLLDDEIVGDGDTSGMKANNEKLLAEKRRLQEEKDELIKQAAAAKEDDLGAKGEYEKLLALKTESWETELATEKKKNETLIEAVKKEKRESMVSEIATELAGDKAALLTPHLANRVQVEADGDGFKVTILDINGNPSTMTKEQLGEEFKNNELFSGAILGRQSSGGGAGGGAGGNGAEDSATWENYFKPNTPEYSPMKQMELEEKNKDLHDALAAKYIGDIYAQVPQQTGRVH